MENSVFANEVIKDVLKSFWDERGKGARYRTTLVGLEYFQEKYQDSLIKNDWRSTAEAVIEALKKEQIISDASLDESERVVKVYFKGCMLENIDKKLLDSGMPIICCPCANVVMHYVDKIFGKDSELVSSEMKEDGCEITLGVMGTKE